MAARISVEAPEKYRDICKLRRVSMASQARTLLDAFGNSSEVRQAVANWQVEFESKDEPKTYYMPRHGR